MNRTLLLASLLVLLAARLHAQIELHLWHQMRPDARAILEERIRTFEDGHPGIRIMQLYKENEELRVGFQAAAAFTGGGPELVYGPSDFVGAFESMHILLSLDEIFGSDYLNRFDPKALTRYHGRLYQVGDEIGNHLALVWNRRLFRQVGLDRAPATFAELISFGKRLTRDFDGDGVIDQYGLVWNYTEPFFFIPFYSSFGGGVLDAHNRPTLDNSASVRGFEFVIRLRDEARIIPRECDYEIADSKFADGRAAMIINGAWAWGKYMQALGSDFALSVLPRNEETGLPAAPMVSCKGYYVNASVAGPVRDAVRTFLTFMLSDESQFVFASRLKTIPSSRLLQSDPRITSDPVIATSIEQARVGIPSPLVPEMRAVWDAMRPPYQSVLGGNMTAEQAAHEQQRLALQKIAELNEGAETDGGPVERGGGAIAVVLYALGACIALGALIALVRNFVRPLHRTRGTIDGGDARFALLMLAPAAVLMFGVVVYPFLYNLVISLSNMSMRTVGTWELIGFGQYGKVFGIDRFLNEVTRQGGSFPSALGQMFSTEFYGVLFRTIIWTLVNVTLHVVIGVMLAMLLNRRLPGKAIFRVLLILPWAVPQYITALTWRGMFNTDSGAINAILKNLFAVSPLPWLTDTTLAFVAAIITNVWLGFPFMMMIALGGLQSIPKELYEAAEIDGASGWQQFRTVTVPLLRPVMIPAITLGIVWTFNNINVIWLVSNGGQPADQTHILVSYVYRAAFNLYRYGYAAAFSFIIFLILAIFSLRFMRRTSATETVY